MRAYGMRLPVVFASMLTVLGLLFGLQFAYAVRTLTLPLTARLRATPGVVGAPVVAATPDTLHVQVRLRLVPDLRATYDQLLAIARQAAGGRRVDLEILDNRSPELTRAYYQLNPILAQGRATGQFVPMEQMFAQESRRLGLDRADVVVGNQDIFVTLVSGEHYLYQVVPLTLGAPGGGDP
jgi:hypothetical protein